MGIVRRRAIAIVIPAVLALLGGAAGATAAAQVEVVMPGVSVGGMRLEGLSGSALKARLTREAKQLERRQIEVSVREASFKLRPVDLGITADVTTTAGLALGVGRPGPVEWLRQKLRPKVTEISWRPKVDVSKFNRELNRIAAEVRQESLAGDVQLVDGHPVITLPLPGVELHKERARRQLLKDALNTSAANVELPFITTSPSVGTLQVARAENQVRSIISAPVEFVAGDRKIVLAPEVIASTLRVRPVFADPEDVAGKADLVVQADPIKLRDAIVAAAPGLVTEPKDARFAVEGDSVRVIPGEDGTTVNGEQAADAVNRLRNNVLRSPISLTIVRHPSTFKTEEALALGITQKVATFTTAFDPTNSPRVHNIDLMAEATDGSLVRPGEEFSLNDTTGPRDEANGYREAQIILNGELVPGIGGGVCQFGTTLFNAVFFAGLEVNERHNHSLYISKYPVGRDATVFFDGGRDLAFTNDTPYGILVKAAVNRKSLTISLYSSPVGRTVTYETSDRRNPKPAPTKYVDDPTLPAGQEVVQEPGQPGFDITVVRIVKEGDKIVHRDTFVSKYRPWKHIVRRGTGAPAPSPSPSPSSAVPAAPA